MWSSGRRVRGARALACAGLVAFFGAGCGASPPPTPEVPAEEAAIVEGRARTKKATEALARGETDQALALALEALDLHRASYGEASAEAEGSLELLADIYFARGELDGADQALTRALAIREILVGPTDPLVAEVLERLFAVYERQGRIDRAEPVAVRAVAIQRAQGEAHRLDLAAAQLRLGSLYLQQCKVDQAAPLLPSALANAEASLPAGSPLLFRYLDSLADLHRYQGNSAEALTLLAREERLLSVRDLDGARRMMSILQRSRAIARDRDDIEGRTSAGARALVVAERWLSSKDPVLLDLALALVPVFEAAGNRAKAVLLYGRLHLVEHLYPTREGAVTTRLDPPTFQLGAEHGKPTRLASRVCLPVGKPTPPGPAQTLAAQGPAFRACYAKLPDGTPPESFDAQVVVELGAAGEVTSVGALTFADPPDALIDCALEVIAAARFDAPVVSGERVSLPLHVDPPTR